MAFRAQSCSPARPVPTAQKAPSIAPAHRAAQLTPTQLRLAFGLQTKLAVSQPGDPLEIEADRVADHVMRLPAPQIQRTCAAGNAPCPKRKEEQHVQREPTSPNPTGTSSAPADFGSTLGNGQPLDTATRSFFEPRFGADFSQVRVHTGPRAAESAQSVHARAFALGSNVVFNSGEFAPHHAAGRRLIAHELAHVVQQSGPSQETVVHRFGSAEHVEIGSRAVPGTNVLIRGYGNVPYGEMIAMMGDYFESLNEMQQVASSGPSGREQIDLVRWKVHPTGPRPAVGTDVEDAVQARYEQLAARNESHFSTGSSPGNSNRERYIDLHTQAIRAANMAGLMPSTVQPYWPESLEAASNHYLTDAFSAGHIRTPRGEVQQYWNSLYPGFSNNLISLISCYMAAYIRDVDRPSRFPLGRLSVDTIRDGVHLGVIDIDGVRDTVQRLAGPSLGNFGIGDFISIAMHDADNRGLDVTSAAGPSGTAGAAPFRWRALGDEHLYSLPAGTTSTPALVTAQQQTQQMVESAVRLSYGEVQQARALSVPLATLSNPANFRALALIPREDTASTTNPVYAWRAANIRALPANMQSILADQFNPGTQVRSRLDGLSVPRCNGAIHAQSAFDCFKSLLLANPFNFIALACEGTTCPPANANPCPALAAGAPCP